MRWSLILSTFLAVELALSFVFAAPAAPLTWVELEERYTRTKAIRKSSKTARQHAKEHGFGYTVDQGGTVHRTDLTTADERNNHGTNMINTPNMQAGNRCFSIAELLFLLTFFCYNCRSCL